MLSKLPYIHTVFFGRRAPSNLELEWKVIRRAACACNAVAIVGPLVQLWCRDRGCGYALTVHRHREAGCEQHDPMRIHNADCVITHLFEQSLKCLRPHVGVRMPRGRYLCKAGISKGISQMLSVQSCGFCAGSFCLDDHNSGLVSDAERQLSA